MTNILRLIQREKELNSRRTKVDEWFERKGVMDNNLYHVGFNPYSTNVVNTQSHVARGGDVQTHIADQSPVSNAPIISSTDFAMPVAGVGLLTSNEKRMGYSGCDS
ncbi:hypothetical protein PM082_002354 [Marasmius tenuissimus]|nr:hypothetical protein PM082_002354 [Marasmius tenuissimus]